MPFMPHYRISEAAQLLGVSDDTVRRWVDAGTLSPGVLAVAVIKATHVIVETPRPSGAAPAVSA
jgi:predicted site-specific integrase-resolvase